MNGTRIQQHIAGTLSLAVIMLSLTFGALADTRAVDRSSIAANGVTIAAPSPTATSASTSFKANTGGGARWGFLLAIFAAFAIFVVGGLFVVLRARREYLDEQRRKAALPKDET